MSNRLDLGRVTTDGANLDMLDYLVYDSTNDQIDAEKPVIEAMSGYNVSLNTSYDGSFNASYGGIVKNGNLLSASLAGVLNLNAKSSLGFFTLATFTIPSNIGQKLIPIISSDLCWCELKLFSAYNSYVTIPARIIKDSNTAFRLAIYDYPSSLLVNTDYQTRFEITFLLSDNLIS